MAITIRVGEEANKRLVTLEMDIRKSLNGDLMIFDHGDMDIILSASKNKVVAFPKEVMSDYVTEHRTDYSHFFAKEEL